MTDFIHFAATVLLALLFAAFQLGGFEAARGGKLTEAAPAPVAVLGASEIRL